MKKISINEKYIKIFFVLFILAVSIIWTICQPYDKAPDEYMKMDICKYIVNNGNLPHGGDASIRNPIWGISYGFMPIISYMFSAGFMKIAMIFTTNETITLFAARLINILLYVGTVIVIMKIADKLFKNPYKWFFIVLISCLPQFVFLSTYLNNDMLALFSISLIIYSWIIGLENKWNIKSCILLAVGIGICALSYYNAYGFILTSIFLFIASFISKKDKIKIDIKDLLKKGILITVIVLLIAGWWFIRNAIIYNGDFLGLSTEEEYSQMYAMDEYKPSNRMTPLRSGESITQMLIQDGWITSTYKSFIGMFGYMQYPISGYIYIAYTALFALSFVGLIIYFIKNKKQKNTVLLEIIFILNILITTFLSVYYSYTSDYEPQGRYIMPIVMVFMYFVTIGFKTIFEKIIKNEKVKNIIINILSIGISLLPLYCLVFYIMKIFC